MSLASKITFATACATTLSIIGYIHYQQSEDRKMLHEGVIRDVERQQRRRAENLYNLQRQRDLEKEIRKSEEVRSEMTI